jgi:hypothetical protein
MSQTITANRDPHGRLADAGPRSRMVHPVSKLSTGTVLYGSLVEGCHPTQLPFDFDGVLTDVRSSSAYANVILLQKHDFAGEVKMLKLGPYNFKTIL